jgi:uncharacterized protein
MNTIERRFVSLATARTRIERRSVAPTGEDAAFLIGYASVFNEWTTLYESPSWVWREVVRPGAFSAALAERQDVRSLFNHDPNFVLGRTTSGTLALQQTDLGLLQETRLSGTPTIRDLVEVPVGRGDISGQSFGFLPRNDGSQTIVETGRSDGKVIVRRSGERITEWEQGGTLYTERELLAADLVDVSVVTYPAYTGTSVALRGADQDFVALERVFRERFEALRANQPDRGVEAEQRSRRARVRLRLASTLFRD